MTSDDYRRDDRQPKRLRECGACGSLAAEGGGMNVGDETFEWACADCRGHSALVEYGVECTDTADEMVDSGVEVVFWLTVKRGAFYVEDAEVRTR